MTQSHSVNWWQRLSLPTRLLIIGLTGPIVTLNFWAFASISSYFGTLVAVLVLASLLAFILNYPVTWIESQGNVRGPAAIVVFLFALLILAGLGVTLVPVVLNQAQQLVVRLPEWVGSGQHRLLEFGQWLDTLNLPITVDVDALANQLLERLKEQLQAVAREALNLLLGTVSSVVDVVINVILTVVLTFYLLQHGDELWESLVNWLPSPVRARASDTIRTSFQNYFIGQLILGTCMGAGLVTIFLVLKVPFGLLFGITIGIMALVPFGGTVGIITVTLLVTLQDAWLGLRVLLFSFILQQILENLIAPRIIGSVTGLNPVWVFLAILAGAKVGGLLGVVVAVPIAVVIKTALSSFRSRWNEPIPELAAESVASDPDVLPNDRLSQLS